MQELFLLRHGDYQNKQNIIPFRLPGFPLSETGKKQAEETAKYLADKKIEAIYSSPILRCKQTAQIIAKHLKLKVQYSKLLIETKSPFQGMDLKKFMDKVNSNFQEVLRLTEQKGETIKDIQKRMEKILHRVKLKYKKQNILLVSHGDPLMILITTLLAKKIDFTQKSDFFKDYISKGCLAMFKFQGKSLISFKKINYSKKSI